ncbi:orotate phosphoribosyltransferase [Corynebacterium bovis]|uniref:orotate phosphoribosyltransferase n=1 Tax=Corynebacterium bovis TaxID=36808 RepID=UPI002549ED83|nr:orotate phosphoribosyltransferase [Corynebacterium bovis]MDK8511748.1 orotate phosphoribosyltransferase [Corynebacterium bovis]
MSAANGRETDTETTAGTAGTATTSATASGTASTPVPEVDAERKARLAELVRDLAVVHGRVTLSSGKEADYYVDLRRATLHREASPLIGALLRQLTADWDYTNVGGLTLGADPVATAVMHAGDGVDAFVVRKEAKKHGMQRRIEGPDIAGRRVLVVEDTTTTGNSPLTAVAAAREAGAEVVGVATVVDRETGARDVIEAEGLEYRPLLGLADLGLE